MRIRKVPETHIEGFKELSIQGETYEYLSPKYVYLPMQFPSPLKELKSVGDKVLIGEAVLQREGRFAIPVLSPVSGTIKGVKSLGPLRKSPKGGAGMYPRKLA